jgi:hypothetical protein
MARVRFLAEQIIILYSTETKLAVEPSQHPIQWVQWVHFLGVKWLVCEADHSPPSSIYVKNGGAIPPFHNMSSWHGTYLI